MQPYARRGVSPSTEMIRVLLVDDHNLVRVGLKLVLRAFPEICVVGEASDGHQALAMAARLRPGIVVMDLDMPSGDGLTATRALQQELPDIRVLIVTMHAEEEMLLPVLAAGARGFLSKAAVDRDLGDARRVIAAGDVYIRPTVANELANSRIERAPQQTDARSRMARLSNREQSVLTLTAQGYNGPEIGQQLGMTAKTVDTLLVEDLDLPGERPADVQILPSLQRGTMLDSRTIAESRPGVDARPLELKGRTVLLALDESGGAASGARLALALANAHGALVQVVRVIDTRAVPFPPAMNVALAIEDPDRDLTSHQAQVCEVQSSLSVITGQVIDWPIHVVVGTPATSIVERAQRVDAALIIVGLRRHGRVDRALNDETSLNVMRNSTCPVLGVIQGQTALPVRILAAIDFSALSLIASRTARAIAGREAVLVLAYVPPLTALLGDEGERVIHTLGVRAAFERATKELGDDGISFDHIVLEQDAAKSTAAAILEYASSSNADVIAAGTRHLGLVDRWMMGSVSTELVRDGRHSVLIVPLGPGGGLLRRN